jgi:hypothetical protein
MKNKTLFLLAFVGLCHLSLIHAEEGMFPFNAIPKDDIRKKYNFEITDAWLTHAQQACVRFNIGGSGSFVSPHGLVMTNHHVAQDSIQKLSTPEKDLMKTGFLARTSAEELKAPDIEVDVLQSMEDVTARVNAAVKPETPPDIALTVRQAAIAAIEKEAKEKSGLRSDVVTLYGGSQYQLYTYKTYRDVRLVFAPEYGIAGFGGDPDNFNYPRFDLDVAFYRVYENDKPLESPDYFKWSKEGAKEAELLFVAGHPGSTSRLYTLAHIEYLRDFWLPAAVRSLTRQREMLEKYGKRSEEHARRAKDELLNVENSLKELQGELAGLKNPTVLQQKIATEKAFRAKKAANFAQDDPFEIIAKACKRSQELYKEHYFIEEGGGLSSNLYQYALTLVRLADEDAKPDGLRLPEFTQARRESLEMELFSPTPVIEDLEVLKFADSLKEMQESLGDEHPVVKLLIDEGTPAMAAVKLIGKTKVGDVKFRQELAKGGAKAIADSKDPLIIAARAIDPKARELRKKYEAEVAAVERPAYTRIAQAWYADAGPSAYPDATFTLRLSYGAIKGYPENGVALKPFTTFEGLYAHAAEHPKDKDYELPVRWIEKHGALKLDTPINFVSTHDIVGGNSGSPMFNIHEEIVGLVFDGNLESLIGDVIFDETQNRTIAVDSRGILEALDKMYDAKELLEELRSGK